MLPYSTNHPALPSLFDPSLPDSPVLWAVLLGRNQGQTLVDCLDYPTQSVIRTGARLTFFSQHSAQSFLDQAIARFGQLGVVWLVWPSAMANHLHPPAGGEISHRLEFRDLDSQSSHLAQLRESIPPGMHIQPIDRPLLEHCEWRSDMEFYCGSLDNFLVNGLGLCLMQGEEIISEAYCSSFGDKTAEIGAITHAAYRGHGYAPVACAWLIEACAQRGYQAIWSCDADNRASIRVARKLGFRQERAYDIIEYEMNS
jgi:RimJ/RimL family protein N-acetyltransferase